MPLNSVADLAQAINFPEERLKYYVAKKRVYKEFLIPKRSGGYREISAPSGPLLEIQQRVNTLLQGMYGRRSPVHGFVANRSCVTNANKHIGDRLILNFDIQDFFKSIHFGRVQGLFLSQPYNYPRVVARMLTRICCEKGCLPQGAPTSPVVSNMICAAMDADFKRLARTFRFTYTRYADDITFSTLSSRFPDSIVTQDASGKFVLGSLSSQILLNHRFKPNPKKTRLAQRGSRREVTGIIVGEEKLNVRRTFVRQLRAQLHAWEKFGHDAASIEFAQKYDRKERKPPSISSVVRGKLDYLAQVRGRDNELYYRLSERYLERLPNAKYKNIVVTSNASLSIIKKSVFVLSATDHLGLTHYATAFFVEGIGFVTACHAVKEVGSNQFRSKLKVFQIQENLDAVPVNINRFSEHCDLAVLEPANKSKLLVGLNPAAVIPAAGDIRLLGYPGYKPGAKIAVIKGEITQLQVTQGVDHIVTDAVIYEGNSGGPVVSERNEVIAVAVQGKNIVQNLAVAIKHLKDATSKP